VVEGIAWLLDIPQTASLRSDFASKRRGAFPKRGARFAVTHLDGYQSTKKVQESAPLPRQGAASSCRRVGLESPGLNRFIIAAMIPLSKSQG